MIVIGTPTRDTLNAGFTYDLVNLIRENPDVVFSVVQGTYLSNLRTMLVRTAIQNNASHVLFIDSDMRFPKDTVKRLVEYNLDIVGANCPQRTARKTTALKDGEFIQSLGKTGIEEVESLGMGVTLIKTDVFKNLKEPWFVMPYDGTKHVGEDVYFCHIAKEAGYKIFVDHELSVEIGHEGFTKWEHTA